MTHAEQPRPDEPSIAAAAAELNAVLARTLDELADRLLNRPEVASPEWYRALHQQQQNPEAAHAAERDWHLLKLRISTRAGTDPATIVGAARAFGASWRAIGEASGLTAQAAYHRWQ